MANDKQLKILKRGYMTWNKWRHENPHVKVDLSQAYLSREDFAEFDLSEADLSRSDLSGTILRYTNLVRANLSQANFIRANINSAQLGGAILRNAIIGNTIIGNTDLSGVLSLETVIHLNPSSLGVDTILISKGCLPENFLRGCGMSDLDIEYAKLAKPGLDPEQITNITYKIHQLYLGGGIQYYSCFISYNSQDHEFAKQLHDDLQNNSVRCWFAPEDMKIGDQIRPTIDQQIRLRDKLLVILSENSVKSEWVGDEVEGALEEESKGNRLVLFPIRLDDNVLNTRDDWAAKIKRRRHIGDFSNWKDEASYKKAFERLLRDLKATRGQVHDE
jgi:hypothetical protein